MSIAVFRISMSLDGYIAGPNQSVKEPLGVGGERLHEWLVALAEWQAMHQEFAAGDVRLRSYTIGPGLAFLLDGLSPQWKDSLEAHSLLSLDEILAGALAGAAPSPAGGCALPTAQVAGITSVAERDASAVTSSRTARRKAFDSTRGWRVTVIAFAGEPLRARGFDPLNMEPVDGGLLHTRFLHLMNNRCDMSAIDEGSIDIMALTVGLGPHPLFNGVRQVVIVGPKSPIVSTDGDRVTIHTGGLQLGCRGAKVDVRPSEVFIRLERP